MLCMYRYMANSLTDVLKAFIMQSYRVFLNYEGFPMPVFCLARGLYLTSMVKKTFHLVS